MKSVFLSAIMILLVLGGCSGDGEKTKITVLVKMMPENAKYFRHEVIPKFEKEYNCEVNVATFAKMYDIESVLSKQKSMGKDRAAIAVVKTPFEMTRVLAGKKYMVPLDEVMSKNTLDKHAAEYNSLALGMGFINDKLYYLPRKLETRVLFYRKSKVKEAVQNWEKFREEINTALKSDNGYGLPENYKLEPDPSEWDTYDLFTVGYYWSRTPYFDVKMGRFAHRAREYEGTALGLIDRAYQQGADSSDILAMGNAPVVRSLAWEAAFIKNGIYNSAMWEEKWGGNNLYDAIKDGKVFMTYLQQIDCFRVHGWSEKMNMQSYLTDPSDMGLAVMPSAVSFKLTKDGEYMHEGTRTITTGGWWWGIPTTVSAEKAKLGYELIRYITSREIQAEECSNFGMLPVRKDILNNLTETFSMGWVGDVFKVSRAQILENKYTTIPLRKEYAEISKNYINAWYDICVGRNYGIGGKIDNDYISGRLGKYVDKQREILGDKYPSK
ncbi:MAG: ABC transporter substrate-binding protein [Fibrobacterota bacterium]